MPRRGGASPCNRRIRRWPAPAESSVRRVMRVAFLRIVVRNSRALTGISSVVFKQCFNVAGNGGQRRAQFMGDVSDEIAPRLFGPLDLGHVMQDGDRAAIGSGCGIHFENPARRNRGGFATAQFAMMKSGLRRRPAPPDRGQHVPAPGLGAQRPAQCAASRHWTS